MMQREDNAAYDYSRFESTQPEKPEIKEVAVKKNERRISILRVIFYIMVGFSMVGGLLYCKAMQVQLDSQYNNALSEIKMLKSDNTRLQIELESKLSLKNIEEIASGEMGLEKADDQKIEYINFNEYDKVEILAEKSLWDEITDTISGWIK